MDIGQYEVAAKTAEALTQVLYKTASELAQKHEEWASQLNQRVTAMHKDDSELREKTMAELASAKAALDVELEQVRKQVADERATWLAEKERISHTSKFSQRVKIDVGGAKFTTSRSTLQAVPGSMLDAFFSGRHANETDEEGYHFIDRDGTHFRHILNFLRDPCNFTLEIPEGQLAELAIEAEYYGLTSKMAATCPALSQLVRRKLLGWLADVRSGCFLRCKVSDSEAFSFVFVDQVQASSESRPNTLHLILEDTSRVQYDDDYDDDYDDYDDNNRRRSEAEHPKLRRLKESIRYLRQNTGASTSQASILEASVRFQSSDRSPQPAAQVQQQLQRYSLAQKKVSIGYDSDGKPPSPAALGLYDVCMLKT